MKKIFTMTITTILLVALFTACGTNSESEVKEPQKEIVDEKENEAEDTESKDTEENVQEAEKEAEPTPETEEESGYTYTELSATMYASSSVNVRDLPDVQGNKLGALSWAQVVQVTGQCNETNWYRIEYNGAVGFVSNEYLQDTKPQQVSNNSSSSNSTSTSTSTSSNTYTLMDGQVLEYGVIYVNVCGNNLYDGSNPTRSLGACPYQLYTMTDNGDGTYTAYIAGNHGGMKDNKYFDFDTSATDAFISNLLAQGYGYQFADGDSWHACVGGYDVGCVHKIIIYLRED